MESHYGWIDAVLDEMDKRQDYPEDAKLRITIEQFWSLDYYLKHAPQERVDKLIGYIKSGDIELTALYANLITEQLGHEECYRALYPAYKFAKECGVSLYSASHCDIPGASWGLCRALCDAGIHFLAVDFPTITIGAGPVLSTSGIPKKCLAMTVPVHATGNLPTAKKS